MPLNETPSRSENPETDLRRGTAALLKLLAPFRGLRAYEIQAVVDGKSIGNHGDDLMYEVFLKILVQLDVKLVLKVEDADFFVVRPNGALLEIYGFPESMKLQLRKLPDLPLVIFPSSAKFPTKNPAELFGDRTAESLWIFREEFSFEQVSMQWGEELAHKNVHLALDQDVVASGYEFVPDIIGKPLRNRHILIAARIDGEAEVKFDKIAPSRNVRRSGKSLKRLVAKYVLSEPSNSFKRSAASILYRRQLTNAADRLLGSLPDEYRNELDRLNLKRVKTDLSSKSLVSYAGYQTAIREAAVVVTDRLHVALPAAIIGKRVILVEAGYHKLTGVYRSSLANLPNVTLANAFDE